MEIVPIEVRSRRKYFCENCGSQFESPSYNKDGMAQCPFCGEWAPDVRSEEGREFDKWYEAVGQMVHDVPTIISTIKEIRGV